MRSALAGWPRPTPGISKAGRRSISTTSTPRRAKLAAAVNPPTPPPTTSTRRMSPTNARPSCLPSVQHRRHHTRRTSPPLPGERKACCVGDADASGGHRLHHVKSRNFVLGVPPGHVGQLIAIDIQEHFAAFFFILLESPPRDFLLGLVLFQE